MADMSVLNVYETAADIGREVENVIDECGSDAVANLMPHVIKVLEQLEALVTQKEQDRARIERLEEDLIIIRNDGDRKNEDNHKLQMEIRQLEELIKSEEIDLMNVADRIQRENQQLKEELSEKQKLDVSEMVQEQETIKVLNQLKETVDRQRDELRARDAEVRSKMDELEALQQQVERYLKINLDLHRKNKMQQEFAKNLIQEKSHLQSQIAAMEQEAPSLNAQMQDSEMQAQADQPDGVVGNKSVCSQSEDAETDDGSREKSANMQWVNLEGKMIIDKKDPNRPRFTLKEMAHVLAERDTIKMKLMELEDDLEIKRSTETTPLVASQEQQRSRADSNLKRDRADSGIKRFFGNILKKLSPQKKSVPGYEDGAWEVLVPDAHDVIAVDIEVGKEKTASVIAEEDVEELRLELFPDENDETPLLSDGDLNKSMDPYHFATQDGRQRKDSACANNDSESGGEKMPSRNGEEEEKVVEEEEKVEEEEEDNRTGNLEADQSQYGMASNNVDINGNTNGSRDRSNSMGEPPGRDFGNPAL